MLLPGWETSTKAKLLLSALAMAKTRPSGEREIEFGVLPGLARGYWALLMTSSDFPLSVSSTLTKWLLAHATNNRFPSLDISISVGWAGVVQVRSTFP